MNLQILVKMYSLAEYCWNMSVHFIWDIVFLKKIVHDFLLVRFFTNLILVDLSQGSAT